MAATVGLIDAENRQGPPSALDQEGPSPPGVTLSWQARQEEGVYGYLVYRSDRREGPFIRINRDIIHARGVEVEIAGYRFVDTDVGVGRTYYYYLDTISTSGRKQRFSGVVSKQVGVTPPPGHAIVTNDAD